MTVLPFERFEVAFMANFRYFDVYAILGGLNKIANLLAHLVSRPIIRAAVQRRAMAAFMASMETVFLAGPNMPFNAVTSLVAVTSS